MVNGGWAREHGRVNKRVTNMAARHRLSDGRACTCSLGRQPFVASRVAFFRLKVAAACKSKTRGWARSVRVGTPSHLHGGLVVASEHEEGCLAAV